MTNVRRMHVSRALPIFPLAVSVSTRTFNSSIFRDSRRSSALLPLSLSLSLSLSRFRVAIASGGERPLPDTSWKIQERSGTGMTTSATATRRARTSVLTARISTRQGRAQFVRSSAHSRFAPFHRSKEKEKTLPTVR